MYVTMPRLTHLLLCLALTTPVILAATPVTCEKGKYPPPPETAVPTYTVDLDLPAEERWTQLIKDKTPHIKALIDKFKSTLEEWGPDMKVLVNFLETNLAPLDKRLPQPFSDEIAGIAKVAGMPLGDIVLYNLFYEMSTFCTSIVTQDSTGKLYHARNMDYEFGEGWDLKNNTWFLTEMLRPLLVNVVFTRGGNTLFKAAHYAGYIGVVTGLRPNGFSISINARSGDDGGGIVGILEWLLGKTNGTFTSFLTRQVLENATNFNDAREWLRSKPVLAPVYYILGGKKSGEGCVITRNKAEAIDVWPMSGAGGWYVLETNYDHWLPTLFFDDRRDPANQCMKEMTEERSSFAGLFNVLSTKPVLNKGTVYTALMQVDSGKFETYIRWCDDPCPPF